MRRETNLWGVSSNKIFIPFAMSIRHCKWYEGFVGYHLSFVSLSSINYCYNEMAFFFSSIYNIIVDFYYVLKLLFRTLIISTKESKKIEFFCSGQKINTRPLNLLSGEPLNGHCFITFTVEPHKSSVLVYLPKLKL